MSASGLTPEEWASMYRIRAALHRVLAAKDDMNAAAAIAAGAMDGFVTAYRESERREIADHPDLAHLDAQMAGYYDQP